MALPGASRRAAWAPSLPWARRSCGLAPRGQRVFKTAAAGEVCAPRELKALSLVGTNATFTFVVFMLPSGSVFGEGEQGLAASCEAWGGVGVCNAPAKESGPFCVSLHIEKGPLRA